MLVPMFELRRVPHTDSNILPHKPGLWYSISRPQAGFICPLIKWHTRGRQAHTLFDSSVDVNFKRDVKMRDAASVQTKFLRMAMTAAWGRKLQLQL